MTNYNSLLTKVTQSMSSHFQSDVSVCDIHPGMLTDAEQDRLKDNSPLIYTTILEILQTGKVDIGNIKSTIQFASFILVYNLSPSERDQLVRTLVFKMVNLIVAQRWGMKYVEGAEEVKAFDLHGVLRKPDEILGTQGWSPTLQARASDLFGDLPVDKDPQFSIWCVTWEQNLVNIQEEIDIFAFPHTVQSLESTINLYPSIKALTLVDWFSETDVFGLRCLTGKIDITPPDKDAQLIARYDLYWADKEGSRLPDAPKIACIESTQTSLSYAFPAGFNVPRGAAKIVGFGRSSHGFSPSPATVSISDIWLPGSALTIPASSSGILSINSIIYKWGGNDAASTALLTGEYYTQKKWASLVPVPSTLDSVLAIGQVGNKIHVLAATGTSFAPVKYDPQTKTFETPQAAYTKSEQAVAAIMCNYDFYILTADVAGFTDNIIVSNTDPVPGTESWLNGDDYGRDMTSPKPPAFKRNRFGICTGNGRIYLTGGKSDKAEYLSNLTAYHPGQRKWTELKAMTSGIRDCSTVVSANRLYVLGGELESGETTNAVICFDFFQQQWIVLSPMTTARKLAAVTLLNGNIYIAGGLDKEGNLLNSTEIYIIDE